MYQYVNNQNTKLITNKQNNEEYTWQWRHVLNDNLYVKHNTTKRLLY